MFWRPSICICGHFDHGKIYGYQMVFHVTWIIKKKEDCIDPRSRRAFYHWTSDACEWSWPLKSVDQLVVLISLMKPSSCSARIQIIEHQIVSCTKCNEGFLLIILKLSNWNYEKSYKCICENIVSTYCHYLNI